MTPGGLSFGDTPGGPFSLEASSEADEDEFAAEEQAHM